MLTSKQRSDLDSRSPNDNLLGTELHKCKNIVKAVYDFAVQGGAISTIKLADEFGNPIVFPIGAIIVRTFLDVITPFTTSASGTFSLDSQGSADLLDATAAASVTGLLEGDLDGTMAEAIKISTSAKPLTCTIATGALTAGKAYIFVEYVLSAAT